MQGGEAAPPAPPGTAGGDRPAGGMTSDAAAVGASRRRLVTEAVGTSVAATAFGIVYGLAARGAGLSPVEASAMSVIVFAGASQFAAVGFVAQGMPWPAIVLLTFLLNARHVLYGAALAPWLHRRRRIDRAAMAHVLTDESFALALAHFRRIGRADAPGYWIGAAAIFFPGSWRRSSGTSAGRPSPPPRRSGSTSCSPRRWRASPSRS